MSITNPKERTDQTPLHNNTTPVRKCQEKTLVVPNAIFENKNHFKIYSHCIVFRKRPYQDNSRHFDRKNRGRIVKFTKRSRFRLFTLLAKIDNKLSIPPIFVSLTYHYGHENDPRSVKSQLHNFLVQLRLFDPDVQFIWRFEYQERGAPHFHLIIFPSILRSPLLQKKYNQRISEIWHLIADPKSRKHKEYGCKVVNIKSYKEACAYLSKYIAKPSNEFTDHKDGKFWGNSRNLPIVCKKIYSAWDEDATLIIEKIRKWLIENGREKYANPDYLNTYTHFVVFVDQEIAETFFNEELFFRIPE